MTEANLTMNEPREGQLVRWLAENGDQCYGIVVREQGDTVRVQVTGTMTFVELDVDKVERV